MKNIDNVNSIISTKLGRDKEVIKAVNKVFWKEVKQKMTHLEDTTIFIKGFTSFTVSKYLIREKIYDTIRAIRGITYSKKFTENKRKIILGKYYNYLRKLLKRRDDVAKIYYERNNRLPEPDSESIEEFSKHSSGDSE